METTINNNAKAFILLITLNVIDCLTTTYTISTHGLGTEANPIMSYVIKEYGFIGMWTIKASILIPLGLYMDKLSKTAFTILNIAFGIIIIINLMGIIL